MLAPDKGQAARFQVIFAVLPLAGKASRWAARYRKVVMSFKRDFHVCECGHIRDEHSMNYPRSKCLAYGCDCQKFSRPTKRAADVGKAGRKKVSSKSKVMVSPARG